MINKFNSKKTKGLKGINGLLNLMFHTKKDGRDIQFKNIKEVLIIDPEMIGDIVMLTPFLRILRSNMPNAKITLVCSKWAEQILGYQGLVDRYIFVNKNLLRVPHLSREDRKEYRRKVREVNVRQYDIAFEPRGDLRYIYFMHFCNAERKISYNYTGGECFLTDVVIPGKEVQHLVEDKIYLLHELGFQYSVDDIYPKLYLTSEQKTENQEFIRKNELEDTLIFGIHPGASLEIKQWNGFAELLERINQKLKECSFIVYEGPNEESAANMVIEAGKKCGAKVIRFKDDIPQYMQNLALCNWVICNDSGAGHIASAYGVNVITIFGPVLPSLARPYSMTGAYVVSDDSLPCKPCISSKCLNGVKCINRVAVDEVFNLLMEKIERKEN